MASTNNQADHPRAFRDPLHAVPVKYKLTLLIVALSLIAYGIGGYLVKVTSQGALEEALFARLHAQAQASSMALRGELTALSGRIKDFASDGYIRSHAEALSNSQQPLARQALEEELRNHLVRNKLPLELAFHDLAIITPAGQISFDALGAAEPLTGLELPFTDSVRYSNLSQWGSTEPRPRFAISTPLTTVANQEPIGYLTAWVNPGVLLVRALRNSEYEAPTEAAELSLLDASNQRLKVPSAWLSPSGPSVESKAVTQGIGLRIQPASGPDASIRGGFILTRLYPIRNTGYSVEVCLDSTVAIEAVALLQNRFLVIGALLAAISFALLIFPIRFLARPLEALTAAAQKLSKGDLSVRVPVESEDEVGHLGSAFNDMASAIEERTSRLEQSAKELRAQRRAAVEERLRLSAVISSMRNGLVVLDANAEIVFSNDAARPLMHMLKEQERSGALASRHPCTQENRKEFCAQCLLAPELEPRTCVLEFEGGTFEIHATRLEGDVSGQSGRLLVSHDITDRVAQDEREMHQERLSVLGEVAAVMAHELNNPLAAIRMYTQLIEEELPQDSELSAHVEVISRNTDNCSRTIRDLLTYATDATPETGPVDICDIVRDVASFLRPMHERAEISLELELGEESEPALVQGDELQLRQIFVNLIMNAIQAVQTGGTVKVRIAHSEDHHIIEVSDDGPGIANSDRERVFRAFFTTKARGEGTGLGLSTARRIAELHGGGLELLDKASKGCTFRVRLRSLVEAKL